MWPQSNAEFWRNKIVGNVERDQRQKAELQALGWQVIVIWECELRNNRFDETMAALEKAILYLGLEDKDA